ncbi:preprotein translocase subunit SecG [Bacillus sp. RC51]|uniref:Cell division protein FtsK n=1 Tax=Bacillus mycoides TaxID=1405 RepID=A0A3D9VE41_BACMY|nr:hypothetical protein DET63_106145 [Bacillus sp. DB-2]REF39486.1 hypothetical protein DET55_10599 [Bacillus mycoides]
MKVVNQGEYSLKMYKKKVLKKSLIVLQLGFFICCFCYILYSTEKKVLT